MQEDSWQRPEEESPEKPENHVEAKSICKDPTPLILVFILFSSFLLYFFHYHLVSVYIPPPCNQHTVIQAHESFFLFAQSLQPITSPS